MAGAFIGQRVGRWVFEDDKQRASLDFDWSAEELDQIHQGEIPAIAARAIEAKWKRVAPRLVKVLAAPAILLGIVWLGVRGSVSGRGDSLTGVYVLGAFFLLMILAPPLLAKFRYSTKRGLKRTTHEAKFTGPNTVQFGFRSNRRWKFSRQDMAELEHGRFYVVYSAGDMLVYLEEAVE